MSDGMRSAAFLIAITMIVAVLVWAFTAPDPRPLVPEGCTSSVATIPPRDGRTAQSVTVIVCPSVGVGG